MLRPYPLKEFCDHSFLEKIINCVSNLKWIPENLKV